MYRLELGTNVHLFQKDGLNKDFFRDIKEIKNEGFQSVEVSLGKVGTYEMHMKKCMENVEDGMKAVLDEGLRINSVHLPFQRFIYISSYDEGVRTWAVDEFRQLIEVCDKYNPKHYVFHSKMGREEDGLWELRKPALVRSFREMTDMTKNNICMENMVGSFPHTIAEMLEVLQQVEKGKCCIDMNHFLLDKTADAILALGKWVNAIHVSDYDGVYEKHWMPKEGINNWIKIIGNLEKIGYNGAFTYEVDRVKYGYTYADIRANYESLFEEYNKKSSR